jgi:hypothetical protein
VQQGADGIAAHVGAQAAAQRVRQVADQREIAEVILTPPVDAVSLKGIEPVRHEDYQPAANLGHAVCLCHGPAVVRNMLEDLVQQHHIEVSLREWQVFGWSQVDVR